MRAVHIAAYDGKPESLSVVDLPVPRPRPGEVLVKVFASPVNPSDLAFLQGHYGFKKPLPAVPGFEGSGTVVDAGSGMLGRFRHPQLPIGGRCGMDKFQWRIFRDSVKFVD